MSWGGRLQLKLGLKLELGAGCNPVALMLLLCLPRCVLCCNVTANKILARCLSSHHAAAVFATLCTVLQCHGE